MLMCPTSKSDAGFVLRLHHVIFFSLIISRQTFVEPFVYQCARADRGRAHPYLQ